MGLKFSTKITNTVRSRLNEIKEAYMKRNNKWLYDETPEEKDEDFLGDLFWENKLPWDPKDSPEDMKDDFYDDGEPEGPPCVRIVVA